jgi:transcriptional regulator with GAF, ATPase, and Fis domain
VKDRLIDVIENPDRSFNDRVNEFEKLLMLEALEKANWVKLRAARSLQVTYRIFNYKYEKFGLQQLHPRRSKQRTAQLVC